MLILLSFTGPKPIMPVPPSNPPPELGIYKELAVLSDKIARYLYEYHSESYPSLGLPPLPVDSSDVNVHGVLQPQQVLPVFSYIWIVL